MDVWWTDAISNINKVMARLIYGKGTKKRGSIPVDQPLDKKYKSRPLLNILLKTQLELCVL